MPIRRRDFMAAAAGAAPLLGASRAFAAASDRIRVAVLGMGGRGSDHVKQVSAVPGVELAALCDPDESILAGKAKLFESQTGKQLTIVQDLRRLLDDKSIDAVTIATCNHWHALAAIWACQAGKHVYVEKPVCHDMFSGAQMVAAARKYNRIVQGGTQRRSSLGDNRAIQALREGLIGDVYMARCVHFQKRDSLGFKDPEPPPSNLNWDLWVGPVRMQPYHGNLHPYNWHWFWDFGNGELANNGVHYIDVARWGLNKKLPSRIYSTGGRFGYKDQGQTPNTQLTTYVFDDGTEMVVEIRGRFSNNEVGGISGLMFYGSKGYMMSGAAGRWRVYLEGKNTPEPDLGRADMPGLLPNEEASHFKNFFDAVRAGKREVQTADIDETYLSTAFCLLGNISYRLKRELHFNPQTRRFIGEREADAMLREPYRAPYTIPEKV